MLAFAIAGGTPDTLTGQVEPASRPHAWEIVAIDICESEPSAGCQDPPIKRKTPPGAMHATVPSAPAAMSNVPSSSECVVQDTSE